jgi:hypothetical protein
MQVLLPDWSVPDTEEHLEPLFCDLEEAVAINGHQRSSEVLRDLEEAVAINGHQRSSEVLRDLEEAVARRQQEADQVLTMAPY